MGIGRGNQAEREREQGVAARMAVASSNAL